MHNLPLKFRRYSYISVIIFLLSSIWLYEGVNVIYQALYGIIYGGILNPIEPNIIYGAMSVANNKELYGDIYNLPYIFNPYTPLYYISVGFVTKLTIVSSDAVMFIGRTFNLISVFFLLSLIAWYVYKKTGSNLITLAVPVFILHMQGSALYDLYHFRPDIVALTLSITGWILSDMKIKHSHYISAVLLGLAFGFKQTYIAAPIAIIIYMVTTSNFRELKLFLVTYSISIIAIIFIGLSFGEHFLHHTIFSMASIPLWPIYQFKYFFETVYVGEWGLFILLAIFSPIILYIKDRLMHLGLLIFLIVSFTLTTFYQSKWGASANAHMEIAMLAIIASWLAIHECIRERSKLINIIILLLLIASVKPYIISESFILNYRRGGNEISGHDYKEESGFDYKKYYSRYANNSESVLSFEDDLAVRLGDPQVLDWYIVSVMGETLKKIDLNKIDKLVKDKKYSKIIIPIYGGEPGLVSYIAHLYFIARQSGYVESFDDSRLLEMSLVE